MASDEESPKSKRQRAAGEHVSQTASMLHHALVGRWVEVYWPEDETWYRGRVTSQDGQKLRVLYDDGEAHSHAFRDDPFVGDGTPPFALEDAPQQWRYALARTTHASGDTPSVPASGASIRLRTPAPAPASRDPFPPARAPTRSSLFEHGARRRLRASRSLLRRAFRRLHRLPLGGVLHERVRAHREALKRSRDGQRVHHEFVEDVRE